MSQVIISHSYQVRHGNIKCDAAMWLSLTTVFKTIYTTITPNAKP